MQFAKSDFAAAVSEKANPHYAPEKVDPPPLEQESFGEEQSEETEPHPEPISKTTPEPEHKKLFKKIALLCHPDKLKWERPSTKRKRMKLFEKARKAITEDNYHSLTEIANELDIPIPTPTESQIKSLKSTILKIESDLKSKKSSFPWVWYHEEDPKKKEKIVETYVKQANL